MSRWRPKHSHLLGFGGLTFTVSSHTEELNHAEEEEENRDPNTDVYFFPKRDGDTSSGNFEGEDGKPSYCVIPTHCETPEDVYYYSVLLGMPCILSSYQASSIKRQP